MNASPKLTSKRPIALQLGQWCAQTQFKDLPTELVARTQRHILDTLGAALAGSAALEPRLARAQLDSEACTGLAPAWGTERRYSARDAAWVNGIASHALELDDTGGCDHSGAVVLPAVLAALALPMTGPLPPSGPAVIKAVVLGYEVGRRTLEACGAYAAHNGAGWHSTATCGTLGAAAAVASLLGLDAAQTAAALGHAASFSGGLWAFVHDASQTKRLHAGRAAEGGLTAALMAQRGISGPSQVFEPVWGSFLNTFAPQTQDPTQLLAPWGQPWKLLRCAIKPYASCRSNHAAIDAVLYLMAQNPGLAQRVKRVDVRLSPFVMKMCGGRDLDTLSSAQMSMPYALALAWVFGELDISHYLQIHRQDARLAAAMSLVHMHPDPTMADLEEPTLTITPHEGPPVSCHIPVALGAPSRPLSDEQLKAKFLALAEVALKPSQAHALAHAVLGLEALSDARTLLPLLQGHSDEHELMA
jgi:2-methylcitrate dehydratase PrpD